MAYTFESRVRYSEVGEDSVLTIRGLINYLQDCSTFQSEDVGLGVEKLHEENVAWMTASWQIVPERLPRLCEKITVGTQPIDATPALARRQFFIKDEDGNMIVKADSQWTLVNTQTGRPMRISEQYLTPYGKGEPFEMPACSRKLPLPAADAPRRLYPPFPVSEELLDSNHHVNNGQYIRLADACVREYRAEKGLPEDWNPAQIRAEYRRPAVRGDQMQLALYEQEEGILVKLMAPDETIYAVVELK